MAITGTSQPQPPNLVFLAQPPRSDNFLDCMRHEHHRSLIVVNIPCFISKFYNHIMAIYACVVQEILDCLTT